MQITFIAFWGYTLLALAVVGLARAIAGPTRGGISPHELVEVWIPGGVLTILTGWLVVAAAWVAITVVIALVAVFQRIRTRLQQDARSRGREPS